MLLSQFFWHAVHRVCCVFLQKLVIYVFDDTDPDMQSYLGKAVIDLIPLSHNKIIKAPFQLNKVPSRCWYCAGARKLCSKIRAVLGVARNPQHAQAEFIKQLFRRWNAAVYDS